MSRLIDADKIPEMIERAFDMQELYLPSHFIELVIDEMPTADAVPVVRCQNCKHHPINGDGYCPAMKISMLLSDDEFCSYGEVAE